MKTAFILWKKGMKAIFDSGQNISSFKLFGFKNYEKSLRKKIQKRFLLIGIILQPQIIEGFLCR